MKELLRKLRWRLQRDRFESELREEMRFHLEMKAADSGDSGAAQRQFGNSVLIREDSRAMWTFSFWEQLAQDARYGLRAMWGNRLFTGMAIVSLALGIGANTAIYSFMDAVLLRTLPVSHPEELVILNVRTKGDAPVIQSHWGNTYDVAGGGLISPNFPYHALDLLRDDNAVLSSLFGHANAGVLNMIIDGQAELVKGQFVTGAYFVGLGVPAAAGRTIAPEDDRQGAPPVAVIGYDYWKSRFAGTRAIAGKSIRINGALFTIAGVAAPDFFGVAPNQKPSVFIPMAAMPLLDSDRRPAAMFTDDHYYWIELMGRLKPGVTQAQAQTALAGIFRRYVQATATTNREKSDIPWLTLQEGASGVDAMRRDYSKPLWILMTMVGLILLIACANVANLLLSRAAARRREIAVRLSLGAGRFRVVRQLLTESLLMAMIGGAAGIGVAALGVRLLLSLLTGGTEDFSVPVRLDWPVLGFTSMVAVATGILFGLAPALQATKIDVTPALRESRASAPRNHRKRFSLPFGLTHVLVVSQIALSLLLVAGAGLFVRTLSNLHSVNLGFNSENILLFQLDGSRAGYKGPALKRLYADLETKFQALPGVVGATTSGLPLVGGSRSSTSISVPGIPAAPPGKPGISTSFAMVGTTFFETMQLRILNGRALSNRDIEGAPLVCVVNEVFAQKYFPGRNPVGEHFTWGGTANGVDAEIVGVVKNARYDSLRRELPPVSYFSWRQTPPGKRMAEMYFEIRTAGDPLALAATVRKVVHEVSPQTPVAEITTQSRRIEQNIKNERIFAQLCTVFGLLALVMACVGLYGTMAYTVARRTGEIGIRMALGAQRRRIVWMVLREVMALSATGVAIGMFAVWQTTGFLKTFLFGMKPNDPVALGASLAVLWACALLAGYLPSRRASRIDPLVALRHE